jgi:hypothetical protein
MSVRVETAGPVWTVIHSRHEEARNAMDPESAEALTNAFLEFDVTRMRPLRSCGEKEEPSAQAGT